MVPSCRKWTQYLDTLLEDDEDVGIAVDEKLVNITNKAFAKQHAIEAVKKKKEAHNRPKNCEKVIVSKVNKEIWRQMAKQGFTKKRDLRLMNIQSAITKNTCAILSVADNLLKMDGEKHIKDIRNCLDAIYLLGHANTAMSMQRRELLTPVLKSDYAGLCDSGTPVTSLLFGDDLPKSLKEARQIGNVGRNYSYPAKKKRDTIRVQQAQERVLQKEKQQQKFKKD